MTKNHLNMVKSIIRYCYKNSTKYFFKLSVDAVLSKDNLLFTFLSLTSSSYSHKASKPRPPSHPIMETDGKILQEISYELWGMIFILQTKKNKKIVHFELNFDPYKNFILFRNRPSDQFALPLFFLFLYVS